MNSLLTNREVPVSLILNCTLPKAFVRLSISQFTNQQGRNNLFFLPTHRNKQKRRRERKQHGGRKSTPFFKAQSRVLPQLHLELQPLHSFNLERFLERRTKVQICNYAVTHLCWLVTSERLLTYLNCIRTENTLTSLPWSTDQGLCQLEKITKAQKSVVYLTSAVCMSSQNQSQMF